MISSFSPPSWWRFLYTFYRPIDKLVLPRILLLESSLLWARLCWLFTTFFVLSGFKPVEQFYRKGIQTTMKGYTTYITHSCFQTTVGRSTELPGKSTRFTTVIGRYAIGNVRIYPDSRERGYVWPLFRKIVVKRTSMHVYFTHSALSIIYSWV